MIFVHALGSLAAALAVVGALYSLLAAYFVGRLTSGPAGQADGAPSLSLLKPLHGDIPGLAEALAGFCAQTYDGEVQIVLGFQDAADTALPVARELQRRHPRAELAVVVENTRHGQNPKVSNLVNMAPHAHGEVLVISDADIAVPAGYLCGLVAALAASGVGAASCLYAGRGVAGGWSKLSAMGVSYQFLPGAALGASLGLAAPCFGSTIALSAATLERIGGLGAFANVLADDYEIGAAVRRLGLKVVIPPLLVTHLCGETSLAELFGHELRWARTIRRIAPLGHFGSLAAHPLAWAILAAPAIGPGPWSLGLVAAVLAARLAAKWRIDRAVGRSSGPAWLVAPRDVLSFAVFLASLLGDSVSWGGERFRVDSGGRLSARS